MKQQKEHKLRMTPGTYYVWCGGSCDYGHEERCSGGAYIMQMDDEVIETYVISDDHTTEFRMILSVMIHAMEVIPESSDIVFLTNVSYIQQNFDKEPTDKSANADLINDCIIQVETMSLIIKFDRWYEPAKENRCIHLYLPDGYDQSEEHYPVIYMFDGHNLFYDEDASFGKSWGLKNFLDQWHKKVIVVGMECSHTGNDRLKEYSPYRIYARMFGSITGIGDLTMQWIVNEVKPYIDSNYRTWSHREATAIGGSSMGGMMALYAILKYNHVFSKSACVSPAVGFAMWDFRKEVKLSNLNPDTRIFFS